jgi:hypothetical protein
MSTQVPASLARGTGLGIDVCSPWSWDNWTLSVPLWWLEATWTQDKALQRGDVRFVGQDSTKPLAPLCCFPYVVSNKQSHLWSCLLALPEPLGAEAGEDDWHLGSRNLRLCVPSTTS